MISPRAYDGKQPFPLLVGFHAASKPIEQIENLTRGSDFEQRFVRAFPKSRGAAWDYATDIAKVNAMYDDLMANYCIDRSRIFATGHMSEGKAVTNGCVQYDGCQVPTVWCSHDDPVYSSTSHGWPCFATRAMYDFFTVLP